MWSAALAAETYARLRETDGVKMDPRDPLVRTHYQHSTPDQAGLEPGN